MTVLAKRLAMMAMRVVFIVVRILGYCKGMWLYLELRMLERD